MAMIRRNKDGKPFETPSGEIIDEVFGTGAKGTENHSVAIVVLPPHKQSDLHYHPICEEVYYMLKGSAKMVYWANEQCESGNKEKVESNVCPGDAIAIPRNYWHQISNESEQNVNFLVTCSPSWTPDCSVYYNEKDTKNDKKQQKAATTMQRIDNLIQQIDLLPI